MDMGCFSISLSVKNLQDSKHFYEKLGFVVFAGEESHNFLIMKNGSTNIGLFHGMFEDNILTFNPGWDQHAEKVNSFTDVRDLKRHFEAKNIEIIQESISGESGPSSFAIVDPDGNSILIDQHV